MCEFPSCKQKGEGEEEMSDLNKLVNAPGWLVELDKDDLVLGSEFQRNVSTGKINNFVKSWSWIACGVIIVCKINNQSVVVDGQHRVAAAKKIPSIKTLPCLFFGIKSMETAAKSFLEINTSRRQLLSLEKFKAQIVAKEPNAVFLESELSKRGLRASSGGIKGIGVMLSFVAQDKKSIPDFLDIISELYGKSHVPERAFTGIWETMKKLPLGTRGRFSQRVISVGKEKLLAEVDKARAYFGGSKGGGRRVYAEGILNAINKGLRAENIFKFEN